MKRTPPPPESPKFLHSTPLQVRFSDIDQLEHVTNSVYQQYYDMGRMEYFTHVFGEHMNWKIEGLILVSLSMDFISPIRLNDQIEVRTRTYAIGNKSLSMQQEIYNHTNGSVCSRGISIMVACRNLGAETIAVPERWRDKIARFEDDTLILSTK